MTDRDLRPGIDRPLTLVFAALGGEGGGLLTDWIVDACTGAGLMVQATSIPGVAQRTGSTTYYIEIMRPPAEGEPLFALYPAPGYVDMAAATDLVEAGRLVEKGYVTSDRTTLIASTHRVFAMAEKTAMGDGVFHSPRIVDAARKFARRVVLRDFAAAARDEASAVNALLLGAMSADEQFPVQVDALERAIRGRGVAVEANLRGFAAGRRLALGEEAASPAVEQEQPKPAQPAEWASFPEGVRDVLDAAVERLVDYQDRPYADQYLERLAPINRAVGESAEGLDVTRETARYLALWMSYEDVMRVADLKSRDARRLRIRKETGAKAGEPVRVTEFFKPGIDELSTMLPGFLSRRLVAWADRHGGRERFHVPLHIRSDTIVGHTALRFVAGLKGGRRNTPRFAEEQAAIERWLDAVARGLSRSPALALEIARCGQLIKGYGETRKRAMRNFEAIYSTLIRPAIDGAGETGESAARIAAAREAALADEEGKQLARVLAGDTGPAGAKDIPAAVAQTDDQRDNQTDNDSTDQQDTTAMRVGGTP